MDEITGQREDDQQAAGLAEQEPDELRREFLKRFGAYTAGATIGLFVLMSAKTSKVSASDTAP